MGCDRMLDMRTEVKVAEVKYPYLASHSDGVIMIVGASGGPVATMRKCVVLTGVHAGTKFECDLVNFQPLNSGSQVILTQE